VASSVLQHHPFQSNHHFESICFSYPKNWSFNFSPPQGDRLALLSFLINFLSFMTFQVFWASWAFELFKFCEIWVRYKLRASSPLWCLSLDFLTLHIFHVFLLIGFMILIKLHAFSPLWCSSLDVLALHYFHAFLLVGFMILMIFFFSSLLASMLRNLTPLQIWPSSSFSWFFYSS
jgi:hypothetical protein